MTLTPDQQVRGTISIPLRSGGYIRLDFVYAPSGLTVRERSFIRLVRESFSEYEALLLDTPTIGDSESSRLAAPSGGAE